MRFLKRFFRTLPFNDFVLQGAVGMGEFGCTLLDSQLQFIMGLAQSRLAFVKFLHRTAGS